MHWRPETRPIAVMMPGAGNVILIDAVRRQLADLEQGRSGIEQAFDPFAREQLAARGVPLARLGVPAQRSLGHFGAQFRRQRTVVRGAGLSLRIIRVEGGGEDRSGHAPISNKR
jgi:hypothetical protein